jgi:ADP-ribosylglycohydrolase
MRKAKSSKVTGITRHIPPAPVRERYHGCLLGGAVGDALGAPIEFSSRSEMVPAYGKLGAITDDTQMTLFTAEGAMRAHVRGMLRGILDRRTTIHYAYLRWLHTQGELLPRNDDFILTGWLVQQKELFARRAPGTTCMDSLRRVSGIGAPAKNHSKGCGGVMRVAAIGMMLHGLSVPDPDSRDRHFNQAFELASDAAALTHGHPTGFLTAGVMALLIFGLLDGTDLPTAIDRAIPLLKARERHEETLSALEGARAAALSSTAPSDAIRHLGQGWVADEALAIGVYCALKATTLEEGVIMAVNHDGDSDSTGLITGQLLGAMQGLSAIPARWLEPLELRGVIEEMADDLATVPAWQLANPDDPNISAEAEYYTRRYPGN